MLSPDGTGTPSRHAGAAAVLLGSGLLGLAAGLTHATWQWAVEIAQLETSLVRYPADSAFLLTHANIWSLVHQVMAPALAAGLSERTASAVLSGALGVLSFQALAMVTFAIGRQAWIAIGAPLLIFVTGAALHGVTYPIYLAGTSHTYGAVGLSMVVLVVGLLSTGHARSGGFLLGLAPALHPGTGAWAVACIVAVAVIDRRARAMLRPAIVPALTGGLVTIVSLAAHQWLAPDAPAISPAIARSYLDAFVLHWDGHRIPASWRAPGSIFVMASLVLAAIWLRRSRGLPDGGRLLLLIVIVSGAASLAMSTTSWLPPGALPAPIVIAMPARFLNVNAMMFAALLVGLLASLPNRRTSGVVLVVFAGALLLTRQSALMATLASWRPEWSNRGISQGAVLLAAAAGLAIWALVRRPDPAEPRLYGGATFLDRPTRRRTPAAVAITVMLGVGLPASWILIRDTQGLQHGGVPLWQSSDAHVLTMTASRPGLLLTGGDLWLVQARTRRPILFDLFTIDTVPYALGAAPAVNALLKDVYGLDLLAPPPRANVDGHVRAARETWQARTREGWRDIRQAYGVTDVLAKADWRLDLPIVAASPGLVLYEIPK